MNKLLFAVAAAAIACLSIAAQAQNVAPAIRFFDGPSAGQVWDTPDARMGLSFNAQTGTTYTVLVSDIGKVITIANGGAIAVTLPAASATFIPAGKCFVLIATGAGTITVTPTTSTINGQTTKTYATNAGGKICSDGTNYLAY